MDKPQEKEKLVDPDENHFVDSDEESASVAEVRVMFEQPRSTLEATAFFGPSAQQQSSQPTSLGQINKSALQERADMMMTGNNKSQESWVNFILGGCGLWECLSGAYCPDKVGSKEEKKPFYTPNQ